MVCLLITILAFFSLPGILCLLVGGAPSSSAPELDEWT